MASLTHRYIPRHRYIKPAQVSEENLFIEEYYSSTDTKIYIDNIEQTEISYISYSLSEQIKPLYGYGSNTFDDVAIGSRIVTGILKTPICNTSLQSTPEDIAARALSAAYGDTAPDLEDYNETEASRVENTDWIGNTDKTPGDTSTGTGEGITPPAKSEEDIWYEYRNKLELLGYLTEGYASNEMLVMAIKIFQKDHGIEADGDLNARTQDEIDKALAQKDVEWSLVIPAGIMMYSAPMFGTPMYTNGIPDDLRVFLMAALAGENGPEEWLYVTTADGSIVGYINANDDPSFKEYLENAPLVYG